MKSLIAGLLGLSVLCGELSAQSMREAPVVLPVPADARIEVRRDLVYKRDGDDELRMDVYLPSERALAARLPAVVFIHGGPVPADWTDGAKATGQYASLGRLIAASGWVGVAFNHRFADAGSLPVAATDVLDAIDWLRSHAAEHSVDPDRLCVWAISAGGLFVAPWLRQPPPFLRCLLLYYAAVEPATLQRMLADMPPEFVVEYDAVAAIASGAAASLPILIARAGHDFEALHTATERFVTAGLTAGATIDLLNHPAGQHAFDIRNDDERSREILRRSLDFIGDAFDTASADGGSP